MDTSKSKDRVEPTKEVAFVITTALRGCGMPDQLDTMYSLAYCALIGKKIESVIGRGDPIISIVANVDDNDIANYLYTTLSKLEAGVRTKIFDEIFLHVTEDGLKDFLLGFDSENAWDRIWHLEHSTPRDVIMLALHLLSPRAGSRIADFGSGIGSFLLQARDFTNNPDIFGIEINSNIACLSRIRLSVPKLDTLFGIYEGVPDGTKRAIAKSLECDIRIGDMLTFHEHGICDYAFSNYPAAMRTAMLPDSSGFARRARAGELGYRRPATADWVYNQLLIDAISEDGKAVALMAGGACYNTTDAGARRYFVEHGLIESIISLPPRLFPGTSLNMNIIVLSRGNVGVRMVDASDLYDEGRRTNRLSDGAIKEITRRLASDIDGYSGTVGIDELAAADFALSPSRYLGRPLVIKDAKRLGDITREIKRGATLRAGDLDEMSVNNATDYRYLMLRDIQDGTIADELPYLNGIDEKLEKHCIEDGDVLLSKNGAPFKVTVAEVPENTTILANGNLYILKVDRSLINPYYLAAFLGSNKGMEVLSSAVVGVTIPNIPLRTLREVPVPVPPLEEQEEIVATYQAKLDEVRILKLRAQRALDEVRSLFDGEE